MTFSIHVKWKNGGGAIIDEFRSSSQQSAIKKAAETLKAYPSNNNIATATLNRHLRGGRYDAVYKWDFNIIIPIINKKP